jgi:hypothetical protein
MSLNDRSAKESLMGRVVTAPFVTALVILIAGVVLVGPVGHWMKIKHAKRPLPLRAPLSGLDEEALAPYRVTERHTLDPAIVEALGTQQYISWTLEDTTVPATDPLRYALLLVTYDTGGRNLVPHRPDVCYLGAGYEPAQPHENTLVTVPSLSPDQAEVRPSRTRTRWSRYPPCRRTKRRSQSGCAPSCRLR